MVSRHIIADYEEYTAELEEVDGLFFLHCDVRIFNKRVYKRMLRDFVNLEDALEEQGITRIYSVPNDKKGFITKNGWSLITTTDEGKEVYVWETQ